MLGSILTQLPMMSLTAIAPGTNMGPLLGLAGDLSPKTDLPNIPGQVTNNNAYWRGYQDGYETSINRRGIKTRR